MIYKKIENFVARFMPTDEDYDDLLVALKLARCVPLMLMLGIPYLLSRGWWLIKVFWNTPKI